MKSKPYIIDNGNFISLPDGAIALNYVPFNIKKPLTIVSHLIRKFTGLRWHHTNHFVWWKNCLMINEIDAGKVLVYPAANGNLKRQIKVFVPHYRNDSSEQFKQRASDIKLVNRIGKTKYDYRGLFLHHVVDLIFGIWIGPKCPGKAYEKFVCSEYTAWVENIPDAYKFRPKDVLNWCRSNGRLVFEGTLEQFIQVAINIYE